MSDHEIHAPPHKIDNQHRECKTGGGAYFAFFLGSDNSHTTTPKIPPDVEGLLWGWRVVRGPLLCWSATVLQCMVLRETAFLGKISPPSYSWRGWFLAQILSVGSLSSQEKPRCCAHLPVVEKFAAFLSCSVT